MNVVGINISKGKSMIANLRPYGEIVSSSFEVHHTSCEISFAGVAPSVNQSETYEQKSIPASKRGSYFA